MGLQDQIDDARRHVRKLMTAAPYLFPEWQSLQRARDELDKAQRELKRARAAWRALGRKK